MSRATINVSGVVFEFDVQLLESHPSHTLTKMYEKTSYSTGQHTFFVGRPSPCFAAILGYYQTGELHMPNDICPKAFKNELEYWNISETEMAKCCLYRYMGFIDDLDTHERFKAYTNKVDRDDSYTVKTNGKPRCLDRYRQKMWTVIDNKDASPLAKIYLCIAFIMVLLSIVNLALSTVPSLQRKPTKCEMLEYMEYSDHEYFDETKTLFGEMDCANEDYYDDFEQDIQDEQLNMTDVRGLIVHMPTIRVRHGAFDAIEIIIGAFFTIDLCMRLFSCPSLTRYFLSVLNIFDIIALVGFYAHMIVINTDKEFKYSYGWIRFIEYIQIFRILRLFRVVKTVRACRVLTFSFHQNLRDMTLLVLVLLIGVSTSSCLVYFIEDQKIFPSIPVAWYWSIITITTVGYGDIHPVTGPGQALACVLAISGVLLLAITLPMFVNNFLTLYQLSCLDDMIVKNDESRILSKATEKSNRVCVIGQNNTNIDCDHRRKTTEVRDFE